MPPKEKDSAQTFSFDTVAVLVATIIENGGSLGAKEFKRMSALDGNRGEHGFNHMFRAVKARAKELSDQAKDSGEMTPVKKTKGAGGASAKTDEGANTGAKKRGRRSNKGSKGGEAGEGGDDEEIPIKKINAQGADDGNASEVAKYEFEFEF